MTCKYVKELIEELQRFNPEARLEHEVEVQSYSPSTLCSVRLPHLEQKIEDMALISNAEPDDE